MKNFSFLLILRDSRTNNSPNSIEAEIAVLGGLILDNEAWEQIADILQVNDFYIDLSSIDVTRLSSNFFLANSINLFISSMLLNQRLAL